jgi:triosephosphate isomerase (TIM)
LCYSSNTDIIKLTNERYGMAKLVVANWKMAMTHSQALSWFENHKRELFNLAQSTATTIIMCPSYTELEAIGQLIQTTPIALGAQNCAVQERGSYTGDISVLSLKELGCSYCIIGHTEQRKYHHETDGAVADKTRLLIGHNIKPIICVGEKSFERASGMTIQVLKEQLDKIIPLYKQAPAMPLCIAYEPVWAIGTNQIPTNDELYTITSWMRTYVQSYDAQITFILLYGGSVTDTTIQELKKVTTLDGFLLGKASLDFQVFKKIVISF